MRIIKRLASAALILSVLLTVALGIFAEGANGGADKKEINVWIIAGQSNACGFGEMSNYPEGYSDADLLDQGVSNVLYYGEGGVRKSSEFIPVSFGLGRNSETVGAEAGIATALADDGQMHAVIKYAFGDTQLTAVGVNTTTNVPTWTSPSYVRKHPDVKFEGDRISELYHGLIDTVTAAVAQLTAQGYTPVVRGLWWHQCERDSNTRRMTREVYAEALRDFIKDVRADLGTVVGADLSDMPFVYARILRNPDYAPNSDIGLAAVEEAQDEVAQDTTLTNVAMLDMRYDLKDPVTNEHRGAVQQDGWHFDSLSQQMIGEAFVRAVEDMTGTVSGYGTIPHEYLDAAQYPAVLFSGGEFVGAYTSVMENEGSALGAAISLARDGKNISILLRADARSVGTVYNVEGASGNINIDLNGHTVSAEGADLFAFGSAADALTVSIYGGNAALGGALLAAGELSGTEIRFGDMNILAGASTRGLISATGTCTGASITFNGCYFDITDIAEADALFNLGACGICATVNGGTVILAESTACASLYMLGGTSQISFGSLRDRYTEIRIEGGTHPILGTEMYVGAPITAAQDGTYVSEGESYDFVYVPAATAYKTYSLHKITSTEQINADGTVSIAGYGNIPAQYADAISYPVALFSGNEFVGAYPYFANEEKEKSALDAAVELVASLGEGDRIRVLLRANAEATCAVSGLGKASCDIDVDLNGYTLVHLHTSPLFMLRTVTEEEGDKPFSFNLFGGSIHLRGYLFELGAEANDAYTALKSAAINVKDVTFTVTRNASLASFLSTYSYGYMKSYNTVNYGIVLEDCTIDLRRAAKLSRSVFNLDDYSEQSRVAASASIKGGKLILGTSCTDASLVSANGISSVRFYENASGEYMSVNASAELKHKVLSAKIITDSGACYVYVPSGIAEDGRTEYSLYPEMLVDYEILAGVSVYGNEITYNVYVPASSKVVSVNVGGKVYTYEECEALIERIDYKKYYKLTATVSARGALDDIPVAVTLKLGDAETVDAHFNLNVEKYASLALASDITDSERTVVQDIIAYVKSVYEQLGITIPQKG